MFEVYRAVVFVGGTEERRCTGDVWRETRQERSVLVWLYRGSVPRNNTCRSGVAKWLKSLDVLGTDVEQLRTVLRDRT